MCEEESVPRRGAGAEVWMCAKLVHAEPITGFRNTQVWASRSEEAKGVKPREGGDALRTEDAPGERSDCSGESCCDGK